MPKPRLHPNRNVRDEADARSLLADVLASGQPLKPWCRAHNINAHSLYGWRTKLFGARVRRPPPVAPEDVPVAEVSIPRSPEPIRYEVELPNRVVVRVDGRFEAPVLQRLLSVALRC